MQSLRSTQVDRTNPLINFAIGQPDFSLLPHQIIQQAAQLRLGEGDTELLNYGLEQGDARFRHALAHFLSQGYAQPVAPETLMVTAGASQALDLFCTLFTQPGDVVFVEEPSYFIALRILLEDHQLRPVAIPTDADGMDLDALEAALAHHRPRFVYTIPTFQNPTGRTLSPERRARLVALAEAHDFLIVADEVYHLLGYGVTPPAPMASFLESERVFSVGSFSKILAPGLRLGWIQTAPSLVDRFVTCGLVDSGGGLNHFTANLVAVVLEQGWQDDYLARIRDIYQQRIARMDKILRAGLGDLATWSQPQGGYFFWLTFGEGVDTERLLPLAQAQGVGFLPGVKCSSQGGCRNSLRLSFAHYGEAILQEGLARLTASLASALDGEGRL
jgi:DNA-binding transcriptional MocR family regulator